MRFLQTKGGKFAFNLSYFTASNQMHIRMEHLSHPIRYGVVKFQLIIGIVKVLKNELSYEVQMASYAFVNQFLTTLIKKL